MIAARALPPEPSVPPEARGLARDEVRLMVARAGEPLIHAAFLDLPRFLRAGDLLVVNESATLPAALKATRADGTRVDLHLSTPEPRGVAGGDAEGGHRPRGVAGRDAEGGHRPRGVAGGDAEGGHRPRGVAGRDAEGERRLGRVAGGNEPGRPHPVAGADGRGGRPERWIVELRRGGERFRGARASERLELDGGGRAVLVAPYLSPGRLWVARLLLPTPLDEYLEEHGAPIRYAHEPRDWPLAARQTIFARHPGSAEMPSAGRPFSPRVLARLPGGVGVAPVTLHTGVSSLERGERPYPERYTVPHETAARVNAARRVIAVGTTVTRALETVADEDGTVSPGSGWTSLTITPERGLRAVDGLITGWHEPDASHLLLLEALAGRELVERSYAAALAAGYRWHEFGDSHLLLTDRS